jgi:hypothetical protein
MDAMVKHVQSCKQISCTRKCVAHSASHLPLVLYAPSCIATIHTAASLCAANIGRCRGTSLAPALPESQLAGLRLPAWLLAYLATKHAR